MTVFVLRLPQSACAYRGLTTQATQNSAWLGAYLEERFGPGCWAGHLVPSGNDQGGWNVTGPFGQFRLPGQR